MSSAKILDLQPGGSGFKTLFYKEMLRFWKVSFQTVAAPVMTAMLYLLVFSHILESRSSGIAGVSYAQFLLPGLIMMSVLQNAFANASSSLIQSRITGNLIFILLPPISLLEFFTAYVLAAIVRGVVVGVGVYICTISMIPPLVTQPLWLLVFLFMGSALFAIMGLIAGIWAEKFDQLAAFQNFIIMPATFLSGVFYSIHSLPPTWQKITHLNPVFYIIDGFRYGFFGASDISPWLSLGVITVTTVLLGAAALYVLRTGYKLRQ